MNPHYENIGIFIDPLKERARITLQRNDCAHQYDHSDRVANLATTIQRIEGGDLLCLLVESYTHDWGSYLGRAEHVEEKALSEIRRELVAVRLPESLIKKVIEDIREHEAYDFSRRGQKVSQECLILQDVDRLDAIGAIGIARCFYTTAILKKPLGKPEDMQRLRQDYHLGQITSAIQHFYTKLLNLKDSMNTECARQIAQERHDFMLQFLERFRREWKGEA